ncbi:MAG: hypothetical protein ACRDBG_13975 [Waterburya sp.]
MSKAQQCLKLSKCTSCEKSKSCRRFTIERVKCNLCESCHKRITTENAKRKAREKREKLSLKRAISHDNIKKDIQKIVRLGTGEQCCTCGATFDSVEHKKTGGHFIMSSYRPTAYLVKNINQQCHRCNGNQRTLGEQYAHSLYIEDLHGESYPKFLFYLSKVKDCLTPDEYLEFRKKITEVLHTIEKEPVYLQRQKILKEFTDWQEQTTWFKRFVQQIQFPKKTKQQIKK